MSVICLDKLKELQLAPGIRARVVNTGNLSVAHVILDEGALLPAHTHHNEQVVNVIEGELELIVAGETLRLPAGHSLVLAPMVPHSGRAIKRCYVVDIFHPVRDDFVRALSS
jgi:quercetin dioxygenase-like cupin family protein